MMGKQTREEKRLLCVLKPVRINKHVGIGMASARCGANEDVYEFIINNF